MTQENNTNKTKNLYLNGLEAVMPSALTQTRLFQVVGHGAKAFRQKTVRFHGNRTYEELHIYDGYQLDIRFDYPIFHYLLMQHQKQNSNSVEIDINQMLKALNRQVREENKKDLIERIKQFRRCEIEVHKVDKSADIEEQKQLPEVITSLILEVRKVTSEDSKSTKYDILFPKDIKSLVNNFDTQKIDLAEFLKIRSKAGKAIFLQLKSQEFITTPVVQIPFKKFKLHFNKSRSNKRIAQDLRQGFEELINLNLIAGYKETKTKEGNKTFKIKKIKKQTKNKNNKGE